MPSPVAGTRAGQPRGRTITLRMPLATRGPGTFHGLSLWFQATLGQLIVAGQRHAYGIVTMARICFKHITNWLHLSGASRARERPPTLLPGQVTERNLYATVQRCGVPPYAETRLRTGPHSLTPMSYSGAGPGPPERGQSGSQATGRPSPGVAPTDEIPGWPRQGDGGTARRISYPERGTGLAARNRPGAAPRGSRRAAARAAGPQPGPPGAASRDSPAHCAYPEWG